eukprot:8252740-Alexandrium_andersonii.AAC.1
MAPWCEHRGVARRDASWLQHDIAGATDGKRATDEHRLGAKTEHAVLAIDRQVRHRQRAQDMTTTATRPTGR